MIKIRQCYEKLVTVTKIRHCNEKSVAIMKFIIAMKNCLPWWKFVIETKDWPLSERWKDWSLQWKIGHFLWWIFHHSDQKRSLQWKFHHCNKKLNTVTIISWMGREIVRKFLSWWPIFHHNDKIFITVTKFHHDDNISIMVTNFSLLWQNIHHSHHLSS